jgi:FOG: WD40 repeat
MNKQGKPQFRLVRALHDSSEGPHVFAVDGAVPQSLDRRKFLRLGAGVPAAAALATFWAERTAAAQNVIRAHRGAISSLLVSADGATLVSGSGNEEMKSWTLPGGAPQGSLTNGLSSGGVWALSPDGSRLAHASFGEASIYTFPEGRQAGARLPLGFLQPTTIASAPDGNGLAITNGLEILVVSVAAPGDLQLKRRIQSRSNPTSSMTCLAVSDAVIILGSQDGWIRTWNLASGAPLGRFNIGGAIISILLLPGQPTVVTGHADGTINFVSLTDGKFVTVAKSDSPVRALVLGPGGKSLVAGSENGSVESVSLLSGERLPTGSLALAAGTQLTTMALVPVQNLLAVGTSSGQIILLDWPSLEIRTYLFNRGVNDAAVEGVSFQMLDPSTGRTVTYTLPCGSEIPPGATCVCNCVPGTAYAPTYTPTYTPSPRSTSPPGTIPGETITRPCTPTPVPPGYVCTCNCIPGR